MWSQWVPVHHKPIKTRGHLRAKLGSFRSLPPALNQVQILSHAAARRQRRDAQRGVNKAEPRAGEGRRPNSRSPTQRTTHACNRFRRPNSTTLRALSVPPPFPLINWPGLGATRGARLHLPHGPERCRPLSCTRHRPPLVPTMYMLRPLRIDRQIEIRALCICQHCPQNGRFLLSDVDMRRRQHNARRRGAGGRALGAGNWGRGTGGGADWGRGSGDGAERHTPLIKCCPFQY